MTTRIGTSMKGWLVLFPNSNQQYSSTVSSISSITCIATSLTRYLISKSTLLSSIYIQMAWATSCMYRKLNMDTFTQLIMSSTGEMGRAAATFYKRLASMTSDKKDVPYGKAIKYCHLSFARIHHHHHNITQLLSTRAPIDLQLAEGHLQWRNFL